MTREVRTEKERILRVLNVPVSSTFSDKCYDLAGDALTIAEKGNATWVIKLNSTTGPMLKSEDLTSGSLIDMSFDRLYISVTATGTTNLILWITKYYTKPRRWFWEGLF